MSTRNPFPLSSGQDDEVSRMNSPTGILRAQNSVVVKKKEDTHLQRGEASDTADLPNHSDGTPTGTAAVAPVSSSSSTTDESAWDFQSFLEEQRRMEAQHDDRKEKVFQRVLSALGGNGDVSGGPELPPEIVQAWGARNEKLCARAENAQKRQQKLEVLHAYVNADIFLPVACPRPGPAS